MRILVRCLWLGSILALAGYLAYRDYQGARSGSGCASGEEVAREERVFVTEVIDGDTVILADGRHVRYIGIDAPERGEANYFAAKKENEKLVLHHWVLMKVSRREQDVYGRTLAELFKNGKSVSKILREKGFHTRKAR